MESDDGTARWIEAGLAELAKGGIDRVRVEVLAASLGVTKGGFYRRFKDRRALLDALLETWARGRIAALEKQIEQGGRSARDRLDALLRLYTERVSAQGMAIELGVRQWARSDPSAAAAAARVDAARLTRIAQLYRQLGLGAQAADARAVLFYSFIFGHSLLFLDQSGRRGASLSATSIRVLTDV